MSVSLLTTVTDESGNPNSSQTSWESTVSDPCPISEAPVISVTWAKSSILRIVRTIRLIDFGAAADMMHRSHANAAFDRIWIIPLAAVLTVFALIVAGVLGRRGQAILEATRLEVQSLRRTLAGILRILEAEIEWVHANRFRHLVHVRFNSERGLQVAIATK